MRPKIKSVLLNLWSSSNFCSSLMYYENKQKYETKVFWRREKQDKLWSLHHRVSFYCCTVSECDFDAGSSRRTGTVRNWSRTPHQLVFCLSSLPSDFDSAVLATWHKSPTKKKALTEETENWQTGRWTQCTKRNATKAVHDGKHGSGVGEYRPENRRVHCVLGVSRYDGGNRTAKYFYTVI